MTNFNDLSRQQMTDAAERFGIAVDNRWSNKSLAAKLIEAGVTIDQIQSAEKVLGVAEEADDALSRFESGGEGKRAVVMMDRPNASFSIMGHKFTKDHPFIVMDEEEALSVCELADGFRIVHPSVAANFYKGQ